MVLENVKEIWTKLEAGHDAGNMQDALDDYLDVKDGRTGNAQVSGEGRSGNEQVDRAAR